MPSKRQRGAAPVAPAQELEAPLAFSYQRVSSGQQVAGHGLDRQADTAALWCAKNGFRLDQQLQLSDRGRSAYSGKHLRGALGRFLELAQQGQLGASPVLLVEAIDRLSRQEPLDAIETILSGLVGSGVRVVTLEDGAEYSRSTISSDASRLLVLVVKIQAAHEFSKRNGMRSKANWAKRYKAAISGQKDPSPRCRPFWLDWDEGLADFKANASEVMVRRCFELSEQGLGHTAIARQLTAEGFSNATGTRVTGTTTGLLLKDRRVLGERQITDPEGNSQTLQGYFPTVVTPKQFDKCRALAAARDTAPGRPRQSQMVRNLFAGVLHCQCGLPMAHRASHGDRYRWLSCQGRHDERCPHKGLPTFPYDEEALLLAFMAQRWADFFNVKADTRRQRQLEGQRLQLESTLAKQQQQASNAEANVNRLLAGGELDAATAAMLGQSLRDATAGAEQTQQELLKVEAALQALAAKPSGKQVQQQITERVQGFMAADRKDPAERQRFNGWLRTLGVRMKVLDPTLSRLSWQEGDKRGEFIVYRAGDRSVVSDESLGDMAVLGFSDADRAVRLEEIRAEKQIAAKIGGRRRRPAKPLAPTLEMLRWKAQKESAQAASPPSSPWPQPEKAWEHVDRAPLRRIAAQLTSPP